MTGTSEARGTDPGSGRVVVVGSVNADLTVRVPRHPVPGETLAGTALHRAVGGKGANQAVAAARAGAAVTLVAAVGIDPDGEAALAALDARGVSTGHVLRHDGAPTGVALITVDDAGENTIVVVPGTNALLAEADVVAALGRSGAPTARDVVLTQLETPGLDLAALLRAAAPAVVVVNPSPMPAGPAAARDLWAVLRSAGLLVANQQEATALLAAAGAGAVSDAAGPGALAEALVAAGAAAVVVTAGARGAWWAARDATTLHANHPAERVVDTTGAGDTFVGALAAALAAGLPAPRALEAAARAGAEAVTWVGAQPPAGRQA